jgi:hypothetical protein
MLVHVYRNLHKRVWSIMVKGRVIAHAPALLLSGCIFKVGPGGLARCRREHCKNVHAFAVGELVAEQPADRPEGASWCRVRYNPYLNDTFVQPDTGEPVFSGTAAYFGTDGACWTKKS